MKLTKTKTKKNTHTRLYLSIFVMWVSPSVECNSTLSDHRDDASTVSTNQTPAKHLRRNEFLSTLCAVQNVIASLMYLNKKKKVHTSLNISHLNTNQSHLKKKRGNSTQKKTKKKKSRRNYKHTFALRLKLPILHANSFK